MSFVVTSRHASLVRSRRGEGRWDWERVHRSTGIHGWSVFTQTVLSPPRRCNCVDVLGQVERSERAKDAWPAVKPGVQWAVHLLYSCPLLDGLRCTSQHYCCSSHTMPASTSPDANWRPTLQRLQPSSACLLWTQLKLALNANRLPVVLALQRRN